MKWYWWRDAAELVRSLAASGYYVDLTYLFSQIKYHIFYVFDSGDFLNPLHVTVYEGNDIKKPQHVFIDFDLGYGMSWYMATL
jgi:hypothetical protein